MIAGDWIRRREWAADTHPPRLKADGAEAPPASDPPELVDPILLQAPHECVEIAFRQSAFGDSRNAFQHLGF